MSPKQDNAGFGQKVMEKLETFRKGESKGALGRETLPPSPRDPRGLLPRTVLGGGLSVPLPQATFLALIWFCRVGKFCLALGSGGTDTSTHTPSPRAPQCHCSLPRELQGFTAAAVLLLALSLLAYEKDNFKSKLGGAHCRRNPAGKMMRIQFFLQY